MTRGTPVLVVACVAFAITPLPAQARLPLAGSIVYNALRFSQQTDRSAPGLGWRFVGRMAFPVTDKFYVGFAVGSWVRAYHACVRPADCPTELSDYSEAVNHTLYAQLYVAPAWFLRAGGGFARTEVLAPSYSVISVQRRTRWSFAAGAGVDIPIRRFLYLTPSIDYTALPAVPTGASEIRWSLAYGIGLTLK